MDDLISRKDAVSRISDLLILELKGARIPTWNEVYNVIGDVPSVPAVPLDKLCEWLADYMFSNDCAKDDMLETPDFWREEITKWMEEQDAADRCGCS